MSEPRTAAGQADHKKYHANPTFPDPCARLTSILAIEAEAREQALREAEGRIAKVPAPHTHPKDSLCITGCPRAVRSAVLDALSAEAGPRE